jgi:hypothetical protein
VNIRLSIILILLFCYICPQVFADDTKGIIFQWSYAPNRTYKSTMITDATNLFIIEGKSENVKEKLQSVPRPIEIKNSVMTKMETVSGQIDKEGNIPFTTRIVEIKSSNEMNGKITKKSNRDAPNNYFSGVVDKKTKRINILSFNGNKLPADTDELKIKMLNDAIYYMQFPDYPLKTGGTFTNRIKQQIPTRTLGTIDLILIADYKLVKLDQDFALFNITLNLEIDSSTIPKQLSIKGGGSGTMRFDMKERIPCDYWSNLNMLFSEDGPEVKFTMKSESVTKTELKSERSK